MIVTTNDSYVDSYAAVGTIDNGFFVEDPADIEHFEANYRAYKVAEGTLVFDEEKLNEIKQEEQLEEIRVRREVECFPIINRGQLWYAMLTAEQHEELQRWYQNWLDAPQTLNIPADLSWIERK